MLFLDVQPFFLHVHTRTVTSLYLDSVVNIFSVARYLSSFYYHISSSLLFVSHIFKRESLPHKSTPLVFNHQLLSPQLTHRSSRYDSKHTPSSDSHMNRVQIYVSLIPVQAPQRDLTRPNERFRDIMTSHAVTTLMNTLGRRLTTYAT
jgi:hypothetical protein